MGTHNASEAQAEAAIKILERAIDAAQNSNQAAENFVVKAAAAPALYEALEAALPRLAHPAKCHRVRPSTEWAEHGSASFENCSCEINVVRAALALARGEQL